MTRAPVLLQARLPLRDPHDCTDGADEIALYEAVFDTLVRRDGTGFVPRLAARWTVAPDARTWEFYLRPGVVFHDGTACDAAAVCRSLIRMARADKGYTLGSPGVWHQYLGDAEITAPDAGTVRIVLATPIADLLDILVQGYIVAPSAIPALEAGDTLHPVGTGPYRIDHADAQEIRAMRSVTYAGPPPANAALVWRAEPDAARRLAALREGRAQVATALDPGASTMRPTDAFTRVATRAPVAIIYLLNAARGPLADPRVRAALSRCLDRPRLIAEVMGGAATPLEGFVSPVHFGAAHSPAPPRDPDLARALLAEAGHGGGLTLTLDCPTRLPDEAERLTAALARQVAEIGVRLDIRLHHDREGYAHMVRRKEIGDLCVFDSSPMSTFRVLVEKIDARVRGAWWQGYHNAAVEALIDRGRTETDHTKRAAIYAAAYVAMQDDPPWLTLYNPVRITGIAGAHPGFALPVDAVLDAGALPRL